MEKVVKISATISILLCLILIAGPYTIFKVCDTSVHVMKCTYSCRIILLFSVLSIINEIYLLAKNNFYNGKILVFHNLLFHFIMIIVPSFVIGGCDINTMRCQKITFPMIYAVSVIGIMNLCIQLISCYKSRGN